MRRRLTATITALALALTVFAVPASAAGGNNWMERVGSANKTVKVGQEFELKVNHGRGLDDDQIKWTIGNTNIARFADDDRFDDEVEFRALKKGTVKITANNLETGGKLVYTVNVKAKNQGVWISQVGNASRTVAPHKEFELRVNKGDALKGSQIKWTISNTNIVRFDDEDRFGVDIDLEAVKSGTAKVTANNLATGGKIVYTINVKSSVGAYNIAQVGKATKYVGTYDDIELEVKKGASLRNDQIQWSIADTSLLSFEYGDNIGREVELESKGKSGTTKVTAHNLHTGGKIVYTVKVSPAYDD